MISRKCISHINVQFNIVETNNNEKAICIWGIYYSIIHSHKLRPWFEIWLKAYLYHILWECAQFLKSFWVLFYSFVSRIWKYYVPYGKIPAIWNLSVVYMKECCTKPGIAGPKIINESIFIAAKNQEVLKAIVFIRVTYISLVSVRVYFTWSSVYVLVYTKSL